MNIDEVVMGATWKVKDVAEHTGASESSVYRWLRNGDLPAPIDPSARRFEWEPRVIRSWTKRAFRTQRPDPDVTGTTWWDAEDIAEYLGVEPVSVQRYRSRRELPEPGRYFGRFPVWEPEVIIEWAKQRPGHAHKVRTAPTDRQANKSKRPAEKALRRKKLTKNSDAQVQASVAGDDVEWWGYAELSVHTGKSVDALRHLRAKLPEPGRFHGRSPVWPRDVLVKWAAQCLPDSGANSRSR
jgi:predicted DNA-binding transcriptional regulator AlpA